MPACPGGWNKDMYFNRKQPLSSDIFLADRCKKTGSSRNRPERNKWIDYLPIDAKQGLGRPEPVFRLENKPAGVRTGDNRIATPVCRCFVRLHGIRPVEIATDRARYCRSKLAGGNPSRPHARPGASSPSIFRHGFCTKNRRAIWNFEICAYLCTRFRHKSSYKRWCHSSVGRAKD